MRLTFCLAMVASVGGNVLLGQGRGSLLVRADSGATVYLNDQYQGMVTSAQEGLEISELKPGICSVVLRRFGGESEVYKVEIKPGRQSILEKRAFRTMPIPESRIPSVQQSAIVTRKDSSDNVSGSERFVGLWREQRVGTFGNAHFNIGLADGKYFVRRVGDQYASDALSPTNLLEKGGTKSYGVVKLEGRVRHYGGEISMALVVHAVVKNPLTDLNSDTLAVQYWNVESAGATFAGGPKGIWVRLKR